MGGAPLSLLYGNNGTNAAPSPLTICRDALCNALDSWLPLADRFNRKWKYEGVEAHKPDLPKFSDLPALQIVPGASSSPWEVNCAKVVKYTFSVDAWAPHWNLFEAERLWAQIHEALYQSPLGSFPNTAIASACRYQPAADSFSIGDRLTSDGKKAMVASTTVTLERDFNPQIWITN
jgi:hypothetical protein